MTVSYKKMHDTYIATSVYCKFLSKTGVEDL